MSAYDALQAFVPSLSKRVILSRYPSCAWQECSGLAARQFGALNVLLALVRLHAGMAIHSYGAYNVGTCAAAILLVHYVSERMMGSIRGSALSAAEVAAFVTFFWMMVQREKYVSKLVASLSMYVWCDTNFCVDVLQVRDHRGSCRRHRLCIQHREGLTTRTSLTWWCHSVAQKKAKHG